MSSMNRGLRNEFAVLMGLGALGFFVAGKKTWARNLGIAALATRLIPLPKESYQGRSVVITGGSRGLGFALAERLLKQGARVTLLARDAEELENARKLLIENTGSNAILPLACDVTDTEQVLLAFGSVLQAFGGIDILINNAGAIIAAPFGAMDEDDFNAQMRLHFHAVLKATETIVPYFIERGRGHIVNISSIGGKIAVPHMSPYCSSKFALAGFTQTLSAELRQHGISVTGVYPGLMRTGSTNQAVFKGDQEKEYTWFAIASSTPGVSISVESAAKQILDGVLEGKSEIVVSLAAKIATLTNANFPEIFRLAMVAANAILPKGLSHQRRTGAASRNWFDSQPWAKPFTAVREAAEEKNNQTEKLDAEFNLNLQAPRCALTIEQTIEQTTILRPDIH